MQLKTLLTRILNSIKTQSNSITSINNDITSINSDITAINNKLTTIGVNYSGSIVTDSVPKTSATNVMSLTLPAGLYIIVGNMQFANACNGMSITEITGMNYVPIVRTSSYENSAGGGTSISTIANLSQQTTLYLRIYQNSTVTQTVNRLGFHAIRIGGGGLRKFFFPHHSMLGGGAYVKA